MFGQFEDPDQTDDPQEGERGAGLGRGAVHRRDDVEERHVVGDDGCDVDNVFKVFPEVQLARAGEESEEDLHGEPGGADGLDDEEGVEEIRGIPVDAVSHREVGEGFHAEQDYGHQRHEDGYDGDDVSRVGRVRIFEVRPNRSHDVVLRQNSFLFDVSFRHFVFIHHVSLQFIEK